MSNAHRCLPSCCLIHLSIFSTSVSIVKPKSAYANVYMCLFPQVVRRYTCFVTDAETQTKANVTTSSCQTSQDASQVPYPEHDYIGYIPVSCTLIRCPLTIHKHLYWFPAFWLAKTIRDQSRIAFETGLLTVRRINLRWTEYWSLLGLHYALSLMGYHSNIAEYWTSHLL